MIDDTILLESESLFYDSISQISDKIQLLSKYSHLVNFKSNSQADVNFRKTFCSLLKTISNLNIKTTELFELLCESHQSEYKS